MKDARRRRTRNPEAKPPEPGPADVEAWKRYFGI